jgi:nitrate reductase molybdenum cofactor assembly chaperone
MIELYDALARLLDYPAGPPAPETAAACRRAPEPVRAELEAFLREAAALPPETLQERYIQAFDLNPACCLDIGWHLFGEEYARGEFLVHLKAEQRRYGLAESAELPDHLTRVLPLVARMSPGEAAEFCHRYLAPALDKIASAASTAPPYDRLLRAVRLLFEARSGAAEQMEVRRSDV